MAVLEEVVVLRGMIGVCESLCSVPHALVLEPRSPAEWVQGMYSYLFEGGDLLFVRGYERG
jgi:hypothetical protein